jgi:hypothetical protein
MFSPQKESQVSHHNDTHTVNMSQYTVGNFSDFSDLFFVTTYEITSCVVVLLKNIDEKKICSHFGMAHINYANIHFSDVREANLTTFIDAFIEQGGCIETASIQILGGVILDHNHITEKTRESLVKIAEKKGFFHLEVKTPAGYQLNSKIDMKNTGDGEMMHIAMDRNGTYTRKIKWEKHQLHSITFNSPRAEKIMCNENINNIIKIDDSAKRRVAEKIRLFYTLINNRCNPDLSYIKENHCTIENAPINPALFHRPTPK